MTELPAHVDPDALRRGVSCFLRAARHEAAGAMDDAVAHYKRSFALVCELDTDESAWPDWLQRAVAAGSADDCVAPPRPRFHHGLETPALEADAILAQLRDTKYVCIDGALGAEIAIAAHSEMAAAALAGLLLPGQLAGGDDGVPKVRSARRGDAVAWIDDATEGIASSWSAVRAAARAIDELLRPTIAPALGLGRRSRPMVSRYADGAAYALHYDNACNDAQNAASDFPCPNRRRLTAIYYTTPAWVPGDGGELRIWRATGTAERGAFVRAEVAPVADRLLLFFSDYRCPHEVLPAWRERFALTMWYAQPDES